MGTVKKRILLIATFPPPVHGSAMVSKYITDSKLFQSEFEFDSVNLSTSRRMEEIGKNTPIKLFRFMGSYFKLLWLLICHRYSLCYLAITINGKGFLKDVPYVLLCKLFGNKIVIHQHNKGMSRFVDRSMYRWLYEHAYKNTRVILLSWYLYDDISKIVKKEDVIVCPNGTPDVLDTVPQFERNNDVPHLLYLSNLVESKGILVLLDAVKILRGKGVKLLCDIIGGDTQEISTDRFANEIASRGIQDMVGYHGKQYGDDKNKFWQIADVFVFPTYYYNECFPLVLLEAMEQGVPCISTDEGGIMDIIEQDKTGKVVAKQDAGALAAAIEELLSNPESRVNMGRAGYEKYIRYFTLQTFEKNITEIFKTQVK